MHTLCRISPSETTAPSSDSHQEPRDQPARPALAEVLDLQETEVPRTAHALQHFFPEA
ncbi:hypothetical protein ABZ023_18805 [Streptomyces sp. NPDC006367]|uniref:hypothetical protein n=1 Tax=unclassified Streptomyces TaxID=2593676 RepID=UPI0033B35C97